MGRPRNRAWLGLLAVGVAAALAGVLAVAMGFPGWAGALSGADAVAQAQESMSPAAITPTPELEAALTALQQAINEAPGVDQAIRTQLVLRVEQVRRAILQQPSPAAGTPPGAVVQVAAQIKALVRQSQRTGIELQAELIGAVLGSAFADVLSEEQLQALTETVTGSDPGLRGAAGILKQAVEERAQDRERARQRAHTREQKPSPAQSPNQGKGQQPALEPQSGQGQSQDKDRDQDRDRQQDRDTQCQSDGNQDQQPDQDRQEDRDQQRLRDGEACDQPGQGAPPQSPPAQSGQSGPTGQPGQQNGSGQGDPGGPANGHGQHGQPGSGSGSPGA